MWMWRKVYRIVSDHSSLSAARKTTTVFVLELLPVEQLAEIEVFPVRWGPSFGIGSRRIGVLVG